MAIELEKLGRTQKVKDLLYTHEDYNDNLDQWNFLLAMYDGIKEIIKGGYIIQNERELDQTFKRRKEQLISFEYTKSVSEIFHFFLFKKEPDRKLGTLKDDELWKLF